MSFLDSSGVARLWAHIVTLINDKIKNIKFDDIQTSDQVIIFDCNLDNSSSNELEE